VATYFQRKAPLTPLSHPHIRTHTRTHTQAADYDRWTKGMGKMQKAFGELMTNAPNISNAKL
jgi:hypothetical protein